MSSKGKGRSAYVEEGEASAATARSSEGSSSYDDESTRSEYPKKGKTRIPARLVSKRALIDLGYTWIEEGNTIIVKKALGQDNIDELLKLSEEYKSSELEIAAARSNISEEIYNIPVADATSKEVPIEVINVDLEPSRPTSPVLEPIFSSTTLPDAIPLPEANEGRRRYNFNTNRFQSASFGVTEGSRPGNETLISGILPLNGAERTPTATQEISESSEAQRAWRHPKSIINEGMISTELFNIHAAEYYMNQSGIHKVTLYCPNRPRDLHAKAPLVRMRWLHLQGAPSNLRTLEDLVTDCPFISHHLKSVALKVLIEVFRRGRTSSELGTPIEPGTMVRYIGRYTSQLGRYQTAPTHDTEPVVFICSPFLHLPETSNKQVGHHQHTKTLLEFLYGYDAGSVRQTGTGAHQVWLGEDAASRTFHVPNTWSLIIGSHLVITLSPLSSQELLGDNIYFDQKALSSTHGIHTVRVIDEKHGCRYHIVVDQDYNYVDFLRHAIALAEDDESRVMAYVLIDEGGGLVDSATWLSLLASGDIENHIFYLREQDPKEKPPEDGQLQAPSMKLLTNFTAGLDGVGSIPASSAIYQGETMMTKYQVGRSENEADFRIPTNPSMVDRSDSSSIPELYDLGVDHGIKFNPGRQFESDIYEIYSIEDSVMGNEAVMHFETSPSVSEPLSGCRINNASSLSEDFSIESIGNEHKNNEEYQQSPSFLHPYESPSASIQGRKTRSSLSVGATSRSQFDPSVVFSDDKSRSRGPETRGSGVSSTFRPPPHVPFLTWRMSWNTDTRTKVQRDQTLVQLLNRIHHSVASGSIGKIYLGTFQCTAHSVAKRLQALNAQLERNEETYTKTEAHQQEATSEDARPPKDQSSNYPDSSIPQSFTRSDTASISNGQDDAKPDATQAHGPEGTHVPQIPPTESSRVPSLRVTEDGTGDLESITLLLSRTVQISEEILADFLPSTDSCSIHQLVTRFWGAVDTILRQLQLASSTVSSAGASYWVVVSAYIPETEEDNLHPPLERVSYRDCQECGQNHEYGSLKEAVDHLHRNHIGCSKPSSTVAGLFDDPCAGWVRKIQSETNKPSNDTVALLANDFLDAVKSMREKTRDLHLSVSRTSEGNEDINHRPHLLTHLVLAFEKVVLRYTIAAKELSWTNKAALQDPEERINPRVLEITREWASKVEGEIYDLLKLAKRDIILLGTTHHDIDRHIIAPVGPELLLASLLSNVQNNTILQGLRRKVDTVKYYRNFTNKTRFGAVRDPKRRRFLEISSLEEELEALRMIVQTQRRLIRAYGKTLHPKSFQTATTGWAYIKDRQAMFPLEDKLIVSQDQKLADDDYAFEVLQSVAKALRHDIKQSIEILEEGHGKAIRVFTIVTLFFLPLSFVTSFFGMNTTDVRDTNWDQRIFWTSALPVTFGVIILAFVYGYKWDSIVDALAKSFPSTKYTSPCRIHEDDMIPLAEEVKQTRPKPAAAPNLEGQRAGRGKGLVGRLKRRTNKKSGAVPRRQTGESLFN